MRTSIHVHADVAAFGMCVEGFDDPAYHQGDARPNPVPISIDVDTAAKIILSPLPTPVAEGMEEVAQEVYEEDGEETVSVVSAPDSSDEDSDTSDYSEPSSDDEDSDDSAPTPTGRRTAKRKKASRKKGKRVEKRKAGKKQKVGTPAKRGKGGAANPAGPVPEKGWLLTEDQLVRAFPLYQTAELAPSWMLTTKLRDRIASYMDRVHPGDTQVSYPNFPEILRVIFGTYINPALFVRDPAVVVTQAIRNYVRQCALQFWFHYYGWKHMLELADSSYATDHYTQRVFLLISTEASLKGGLIFGAYKQCKSGLVVDLMSKIKDPVVFCEVVYLIALTAAGISEVDVEKTFKKVVKPQDYFNQLHLTPIVVDGLENLYANPSDRTMMVSSHRVKIPGSTASVKTVHPFVSHEFGPEPMFVHPRAWKTRMSRAFGAHVTPDFLARRLGEPYRDSVRAGMMLVLHQIRCAQAFAPVNIKHKEQPNLERLINSIEGENEPEIHINEFVAKLYCCASCRQRIGHKGDTVEIKDLTQAERNDPKLKSDDYTNGWNFRSIDAESYVQDAPDAVEDTSPEALIELFKSPPQPSAGAAGDKVDRRRIRSRFAYAKSNMLKSNARFAPYFMRDRSRVGMVRVISVKSESSFASSSDAAPKGKTRKETVVTRSAYAVTESPIDRCWIDPTHILNYVPSPLDPHHWVLSRVLPAVNATDNLSERVNTVNGIESTYSRAIAALASFADCDKTPPIPVFLAYYVLSLCFWGPSVSGKSTALAVQIAARKFAGVPMDAAVSLDDLSAFRDAFAAALDDARDSILARTGVSNGAWSISVGAVSAFAILLGLRANPGVLANYVIEAYRETLTSEVFRQGVNQIVSKCIEDDRNAAYMDAIEGTDADVRTHVEKQLALPLMMHMLVVFPNPTVTIAPRSVAGSRNFPRVKDPDAVAYLKARRVANLIREFAETGEFTKISDLTRDSNFEMLVSAGFFSWNQALSNLSFEKRLQCIQLMDAAIELKYDSDHPSSRALLEYLRTKVYPLEICSNYGLGSDIVYALDSSKLEFAPIVCAAALRSNALQQDCAIHLYELLRHARHIHLTESLEAETARAVNEMVSEVPALLDAVVASRKVQLPETVTMPITDPVVFFSRVSHAVCMPDIDFAMDHQDDYDDGMFAPKYSDTPSSDDDDDDGDDDGCNY